MNLRPHITVSFDRRGRAWHARAAVRWLGRDWLAREWPVPKVPRGRAEKVDDGFPYHDGMNGYGTRPRVI